MAWCEGSLESAPASVVALFGTTIWSVTLWIYSVIVCLWHEGSL